LPEAVERLRRADEIFVPFVVLGELHAGFAGGARPGENEANLVRFSRQPPCRPGVCR
jgi:predicted nucleic acid-binding protein